MAYDEIVAYGFSPSDFRANIRLAMRMGAANNVADRATFRWDKVRTFVPQDPAGEPYRWEETPASDLSHDDVVVDEVAVEYTGGSRVSAGGTAVGQFLPRHATMTILDVDHVQIVGANWVLLHEVVWGIVDETVGGLGSVDVYTLNLER